MGEIEFWFDINQRDFPWRQNRTPYRVWISEVMLQQTRASVVIPYFNRWVERFSNVKALYMASLDEVIKLWEGLGYYTRARNIHAAAKQIVEQFEGEIPDTREQLMSIHGFGPYTVGAVLSFGFQKRAVAIDGNVLRVVSRLFLIEENVCKSSVRRKIEEKAEALLDLQRPWVTAEALIELGATICLPKPRCDACPLKEKCLASRDGRAEALPIKNEEKQVIYLHRTVFVFENNGWVLLKRGEKGRVMADLYEFPYWDQKEEALDRAESFFNGNFTFIQKLKRQSHAFTRYKAHLSPYLFRVEERICHFGCEWVLVSRLSELPFSAGHRKIANEVANIFSDMLSLSEKSKS